MRRRELVVMENLVVFVIITAVVWALAFIRVSRSDLRVAAVSGDAKVGKGKQRKKHGDS